MLERVLREEEGFTLLELMLVTQILSILMLVAVPSWLQVRDNANQATAKSNAKELAVAVGLYYQSNETYAGMTIPVLKTFDASLTTTGTFVNNSGTDAAGVTNRVTMDATHFCTYATSGRWFAYQLNPTGQMMVTNNAALVCS